MPRKLSINEIKQRAGRFCAFRERSPNELLEKMKSWGASEQEAEQLLDELTDLGYVNEQRFANAFCNDKFEFNSWGKQKIKANIYAHRLSEKAIQQALDRIDVQRYEERLRDLGGQKWSRLEKDELVKRKQKTVNYLANKGFELDLIWKIISELEQKGR